MKRVFCLGFYKKFDIISSMQKRRRGIVLISILVLTILVTFFIGALVQMNPTRLRRTVHDENRDRAAMAARAGVDYALNQLKADYNWRATADDVTVEMDDLVIREDRGNVLGWIRTQEGSWAGFRLRFNYQDDNNGAGSVDGYDDPQYPIESPEVSLNNLTTNVKKKLPLGDGPGNSVEETLSPVTVPPSTVALVVEGIVGPGLSPDSPETLAQAEATAKRTLEGIYTVSDITEGLDGDAVLMAGGHASFELGNRASSAERDFRGVLSLQSDDNNIAGVRVKGRLELKRGEGKAGGAKFDPDEDASVLVGDGSSFLEQTVSGDLFEGGAEQADDPFLEITWDRVSSSDQTDPISLPGGVYIFSDGDKDGGRSVSDSVGYYDMTWDEYSRRKRGLEGEAPLPPASPVPKELADRIQLNKKEVTVNGKKEKRDLIVFEKDVTVTGSAKKNIKDLTIIPERGARQKAGSDGGEITIPGSQSGSLFINLTEMLSGGKQVFVDNPATFAGTMWLNSGTDQAVQIVFREGRIVDSNNKWGTPEADALGHQLIQELVVNQSPVEISQTVGSAPPGSSLSGLGTGPNYGRILQVEDSIAFAEALKLTYEATSDPLHIPKDVAGPSGDDATVPQDIEIVFKPDKDASSAFIRSTGDVFLGTHLSGSGGGIVAQKTVNLVGFGIDLEAKAVNSERDGLAIYGGESINISTYDERQNKYWDVNVAGSIFTKGNLFVRLGEDPLPAEMKMSNPSWGLFDYKGAIISLGEATASEGEIEGTGGGRRDNLNDVGDPDGPDGLLLDLEKGRTDVVARGARLFYDPSYLAPYIEEEELNPTFSPVSVVER
jgi:hypothetical protein